MNLLRYAKTERNVLSAINHPFIVKLEGAFQTQDKLFLILEYCSGGDLDFHLHREKCFPEERARVYAGEILLALEELHSRDIIYRDLKPENIVTDASGHCLLTDFGLSKEGVGDVTAGAKSFCG
jgi:serine/threonine protein kinase